MKGTATVFEATNSRRKEVYVTWTLFPIFDAMARLGKQLPPVIAHWHPEREQITFQSLEFQLTHEEALKFIAQRVAKPLQAGWKYIVDRTPRSSVDR